MIEKMLQTLLGELQKISKAETVVGEAITCGESVIIPISRVQIGFGAATAGENLEANEASRSDRLKGAGIGGGIRVEPAACVVVDKTGRAQLLPLQQSASSTLVKALDLVPEVLEKFHAEKQSKKESPKK